MNLRQKLLLLLSLTVALVVAAVAWTVLVRIRHVFEQRDQQETALFVSQFQREFQHRSTEVTAAVDRIAATERVRGMAFALSQSGDASLYVTEAQTLAQESQLDFFEIVGQYFVTFCSEHFFPFSSGLGLVPLVNSFSYQIFANCPKKSAKFG